MHINECNCFVFQSKSHSSGAFFVCIVWNMFPENFKQMNILIFYGIFCKIAISRYLDLETSFS